MNSYGSYGSSSAAADALMGIFGAAWLLVMLVMLVIVLILCVFIVICNWKIMEKAGEPGWKALIPYYNYYVLSDVSLTKPTSLVVFFVFLGGALLCFLACIPYLGIVISWLAWLIMMVTNGVLNFSLTKSFGKDTGICVLAIFFPPIVRAILAFGGSEYDEGNKVSIFPASN